MPTPNVPLDILDRVRDLEDRLRAVEGRTQIRPAQNQILGDVTIGAGGVLKALNNAGAPILYVGGIGPANPDGSPQRGLLIYRQDGTLALSVANTTGTPGQPQGVAIRDALGNTIISEDVIGGGLANPYLSTDAWVGATTAPADTTTSGTFTTLQNLQGWVKQHPKLTGHYLVQTSAGTTGEIRLVDDASNVILGPISIAAAQFFYSFGTGPVSGSFNSMFNLHWQGRVTGGAGSIGVRGLSTYGVQS